MAHKYYFSTKDLLLIAVLCCLGAVVSTYVGYVASAFNSLTGIPMAGQIFSGLHVLWIVLILAIVDKKGSGALAGALKGVIEFLLGGHLGILAIPASFLEGVFAEIGFWPFKKYRTLSYLLAGGLGSWANVLITQTIFNSFPGIYLFGTISVFAFLSGVVFAGLLGLGIVRILADAGVLKGDKAKASKLFSLPGAIAVLLIAFVVLLFALHFVNTATPDTTAASVNTTANETQNATDIRFTDSCESMGTNTYELMDYQSEFINVTAVDPTGGNTIARNYTGLPLVDLVNMQCEGGAPRFIVVIPKSGENQTFKIPEVRANQSIIIVPNGSTFDIVAPGYPANMWVKNVERFRQF